MDLKMDIKAKRQEGASAVEFAIILPLLLILVFGIIEFSILFYDKAMITNASREGARVGITFLYQGGGDKHPDNTAIETAIFQYCQDHLITFGSELLTILPVRTGDSSGDSLTVTVNYQYNFLVFNSLLPLIGGSLSNGITLTAETVMRME